MMKSILKLGIPLVFSLIALNACETKDDSVNVAKEAKKPKKEKTQFTCHDLLETPEKYAGKKVSLNAISWGTTSSVDGEEILMSIDDEKLEGLQQAHVLVHFSKDQLDEIKGVHENDSVFLQATVGKYEAGALRLTQPRVISN